MSIGLSAILGDFDAVNFETLRREVQRDAAGVGRWRTRVLSRVADADRRLRRRVGPELRWRGDALRAWWSGRLRVPILAVVQTGDARQNDAAAQVLRNPGVIVWLELGDQHDDDGGGQAAVRLLDLPGCSTPRFRVAVEAGFAEATAGRLTFEPCLTRFPPMAVESDGNTSPLDDGSAALAAACFASWHRRGLWPDRPIAVSGTLQGSSAVEVGGIGDKCATAADHGLAFMLTVTPDEVGPKPANVIEVPPMPAAQWIEAAEAALMIRGVRLVRHPRLQADARFSGDGTAIGEAAVRRVNRRLDEDRDRVVRLREQLKDAERDMHARHRSMVVNARAVSGADAASDRAHYNHAGSLNDPLALAVAYVEAEADGGHDTNPLAAHLEARIVRGDPAAGPDLVERLESDASAALLEFGSRLEPALLHAVADKRPIVLEATVKGLRVELAKAWGRGDGPAETIVRRMLSNDLTRLGHAA